MSDSQENFGAIVGEFSFGLALMEFEFEGNKYNHISHEVVLYLARFSGGGTTFLVRDITGVRRELDRDQMSRWFAALYEANEKRLGELSENYRKWIENPTGIDPAAGWSYRHPALKDTRPERNEKARSK